MAAASTPFGEDRWGGRSWADYGQFYRDVYGSVLVEQREVGRAGAQLIVAEQSEGDWSDAPVPALNLTRLSSASVGTDLDFGAGRFSPILRSCQFVVIAPNVATEVVVHGPHRIEALALPYSQLQSLVRDDTLLPTDGDLGALHRQTNTCRQVTGLLDGLMAEARTPTPHGALAADGLLLELVAALLCLRDGRPAPVQSISGLPPWRLKRAIAALSEPDCCQLSLSELADDVGLSPAHFSRAFKRSTGLPPHAFMRRQRSEQAKVLLTDSKLSIQEIAAAVGYETPQAFARMFRAEVGTSPSEYRRERCR